MDLEGAVRWPLPIQNTAPDGYVRPLNTEDHKAPEVDKG